jgi:hypothetical protein
VNVRHVTSEDNVDEQGCLIEPGTVHHGTVQGGVISALAGPVDPCTHFNADFREHSLGECVIAERLEVGSPLILDEEGHFCRAVIRPGATHSFGPVDTGGRRVEWLTSFQKTS